MADTIGRLVTPVVIRGTVDPFNFASVFLPRIVDSTAPRIEQISPALGTTIAKQATLSFRLIEASGFAIREFWLGFGDSPDAYDLVHDGTSYRGWYAAGSSISPTSDGFAMSIQRDTGWPSGLRIKLRASVVDAGGNVVVINA